MEYKAEDQSIHSCSLIHPAQLPWLYVTHAPLCFACSFGAGVERRVWRTRARRSLLNLVLQAASVPTQSHRPQDSCVPPSIFHTVCSGAPCRSCPLLARFTALPCTANTSHHAPFTTPAVASPSPSTRHGLPRNQSRAQLAGGFMQHTWVCCG